VIGEWEKETGKNVLVGLSTTKDMQDQILEDPQRNALIDVIDIRYWHYKDDGNIYAPKGGENLAPRQHARVMKPGKTSFQQVYRAVREYRTKFPEKAVIYSADIAEGMNWAVLMAGGSLAPVPEIKNVDFFVDAASMKPMPSGDKLHWLVGNEETGYILYCAPSDQPAKIDLEKSKGVFNVRWLNPKDGTIIKEEKKIKGGMIQTLARPQQGAVVVWLSRK
jgi:hypothetical protein